MSSCFNKSCAVYEVTSIKELSISLGKVVFRIFMLSVQRSYLLRSKYGVKASVNDEWGNNIPLWSGMKNHVHICLCSYIKQTQYEH